MDIDFAIISVGRNCARFAREWYKSITSQTHRNWSCFISVDPSNDGSLNTIQKLIENDNRFVLNSNAQRFGCLRNTFRCAKLVDNSESVLICVDLDDCLATPNALSVVNKYYQDPDVWMTYGSYIDSNGNRGWSKKIPDKIWSTNSHRDKTWCASHLRTFKKWLWDKINPKDFLMPDGSWIMRATDRAFMYPMLEMCGKKRRARYIKNILYKYNVYGQQSPENKVESVALKHILSKKPYSAIEGYQ